MLLQECTGGDIDFDDIINLYFSVKPDFRSDSVWLMNDETDLKLKLLKNKDGLALRNHKPCPGDWLYNRLDDLAKQVTAQYNKKNEEA